MNQVQCPECKQVITGWPRRDGLPYCPLCGGHILAPAGEGDAERALSEGKAEPPQHAVPSSGGAQKTGPLLSDEERDELIAKTEFVQNLPGRKVVWSGDREAANKVRDFYEQKLANGDLIHREELVSWIKAQMKLFSPHVDEMYDAYKDVLDHIAPPDPEKR